MLGYDEEKMWGGNCMKCPYCNSENVDYINSKHIHAEDNEYKKYHYTIKQYICLDCKEEFERTCGDAPRRNFEETLYN